MNNALEQYYRFHSLIYDTTRWGFLFGRKKIIQSISTQARVENICEIGCGTGKNLMALQKAFPRGIITGLDLSKDMLAVAEKKISPSASNINLIHGSYDRPLKPDPSFDLILFSYCLTMIHDNAEEVIMNAWEDLRPGGVIAVVDFHGSDYPFFKGWMGMNHVLMERHLLPILKSNFRPMEEGIHNAYAGLWSWFLFLGQK